MERRAWGYHDWQAIFDFSISHWSSQDIFNFWYLLYCRGSSYGHSADNQSRSDSDIFGNHVVWESLFSRTTSPRSWWTPSAPEPQRTNLNILRQAVPATRMAADPLISESHRRRAARPRVLLLAHRAPAAQADSAGGLHNLKKAEAVQKHDERFTQRHLKLVLLSKSLDRFEGYEWSVVAIETACSIPNLRRREFSVWV